MYLRRLHTPADDALLCEAYAWDATAPRWYREMDAVFAIDSSDAFIALFTDPLTAAIGVWEGGELIGLIVVCAQRSGLYAAHLWARRDASPQVLGTAAISIREQLFGIGAHEIFVYVAECNRPVRQLCASIGLIPDGVVLYKGASRGKVIKWLRHSCKRQVVAMEIAA